MEFELLYQLGVHNSVDHVKAFLEALMHSEKSLLLLGMRMISL